MDDRRFDDIARGLACQPTRRALLRAALGGLGAILGFRVAFADDGTPVAEDEPALTGTPEPVPAETAEPAPTDTPEPPSIETPEPPTATPEPPAATPEPTATATATAEPTATPTATAESEAVYLEAATPTLTLSRASGRVGTSMTATVAGFKPFEVITLSWFNGSSAVTLVSNVVANNAGGSQIPFRIPDGVRGNHRIRAKGSLGSQVDATFRVTPSIALSPTSAPRGRTVNVTVRGFAAGVKVNVLFFPDTDPNLNPLLVTSATTSSRGAAITSFVVPLSLLAKHRVEGREAIATTNYGYTTFTVVCPSLYEPLTSTICCGDAGGSCSRDGQCCSGDCDSTGHCTACAPVGVKPIKTIAAFCCSGKIKSDGVCVSDLGGPCAADSQCSKGVCDGGTCLQSYGGICAADPECASGVCFLGDLCDCVELAATCTHREDCCSRTCNNNGQCVCAPAGTATINGASDCCSRAWIGGVCVKVSAGGPCVRNEDCLSNTCSGLACAKSEDGEECRAKTDCVNNFCLAGHCVSANLP